jgi:phenylalanyl-tRNA synthetase alpha chain
MVDQRVSVLTEKIENLGQLFSEEINGVATEHDLFQVKAAYLGKQGHITSILKQLGQLSHEARPIVGGHANKLKNHIEAVCLEVLEKKRRSQEEKKIHENVLDTSLPGSVTRPGSLHPITQVSETIEDIFLGMGFEVREGPEVENDYYNFEALNIGKDHPARDMQDTFYLSGSKDPYLLRTHTSPVQIHVLESEQPPIQIIAPGPVYRRDSDVSHTPVFHQIEGLYLDKGVSFANLKAVLEAFVHEFFSSTIGLRFRPSYFPFTEPSAELDIACVMCAPRGAHRKGTGCRVCQQTGWLEVMGCGMVHPAVLRASGVDEKQWTGFAFGMGIERLAMLKYRIDDIRLFYDNDRRFLEQFK